MALVEKFNVTGYSLGKRNDYVLGGYLSTTGSTTYIDYDFLSRMLYISTGSSDGGRQAITFSQLDREALEFFRAQLIEKDGHPPELPDAMPNETSEAWVRMGSQGIAHVGVYPEVQRKLTDIFNFESRQHFMVTESLKTGAEISSQPVSFDDLPQTTLETALEQFIKAGGKPDKDFVLRGAIWLKK